MTIKFNAKGQQRKELAKAVGTIVGAMAQYQFMPTCAYLIGDFYTVTKGGNLEINDTADGAEIEKLLEALPSYGFTIPNAPEKLTIQIPSTSMTQTALENVKRLTENKSNLLKHAFSTDTLEIFETEGIIEFPWFTIEQPGDADAYMQFITKFCEFAKNRKRVNNKPDMAANEKYAFRCFLIRIGMVGDEFKKARNVLLRNLTGCSAFRDGRPQNVKDDIAE